MPARPPDIDKEPVSYFTLEQRRRQLEPGEPIADPIPALPSSSPWAASIDEIVGVEPGVDRREDSDTFGSAIDEHDGGDDADHFIQPIVEGDN